MLLNDLPGFSQNFKINLQGKIAILCNIHQEEYPLPSLPGFMCIHATKGLPVSNNLCETIKNVNLSGGGSIHRGMKTIHRKGRKVYLKR